ncbi:hydroxyethylthiazole kinase [Sphingobacterium suaedae]|uniref:Hydroxyethylthiazole kinase n=1 Tax=Sphingobacterium suaedae TaxID=1686402 RepID=A0ABW5KFB9_9SPHI
MEHRIIQQLLQLKAEAPLVHNITNFVVMNNTANALLAVGASPVMVHSPREVQDVVQISQSLVINIGTLSEKWADAMLMAAERANQIGCPWVLDPVGAGISSFRNETLQQLLNLKPTAIRGNASEIMALDNFSAFSSKGVDSTADSQDAFVAGQSLQRRYGTQVCISGPTDYIISERAWVEVYNGSGLMTKVTGLGCSASAMIGAFLALRSDPFEEAVAGVSILSLAGQLATDKSNGPGTLQWQLYDTLYNLTAEDLSIHLNIKQHAF